MSTFDTPRENPLTTSGDPALTLWRDADFVKLWVAQTASLLGSALSRLALPLIAAIALNATPAEMGLLAAVNTAPALVVGLVSGVWVDRYRRRTWLIAGDVGRALLLATIPAAALLGVLSMAQLYVVGLFVGVLTVFFNVASQSYLPTIVEGDRLVEGNGKLALSNSVTAVAGPSLAGIVIQAITAPLAVALDALSYLASAWLVFRIRRQEEPRAMNPLPMLAQVREGLGLVFGNPYLRSFVGCTATSNFTATMFYALYILFGTRDLGLNAAELGLIYGIGASGALVAAVLGPRAAARIGIGRMMIGGALLGSLEVLPVVFATPSLAVPLLLLSSLLGNFGWVVYSISEMSVRQAITPVTLQGRMNATFTFVVTGMLPLGALVGGGLGQVLGLRETIAAAAFGSSLSFLWILFSPVRGLARLRQTG